MSEDSESGQVSWRTRRWKRRRDEEEEEREKNTHPWSRNIWVIKSSLSVIF